MILTILGSGSPEPYARRASSGYLIEVEGQRLLFDCGGGVTGRLLEAGYQLTDIDYLFLSHLHSDHMMDYARLIHAAWEMADKRIKVYGPAPIADINERLFGSKGAFAHDLVARTQYSPSQAVWAARGGRVPRSWPAPDITEIEPGFALDLPGWSLTSCEVPHAQPYLMCLAFRLEAAGKSFVYSGDAGLCEGMKRLSKNADLLLHWCYRAEGETISPELDRQSPTPSQIAQFAQSVGVKKLLLTHFRRHMDAPDITASAKAALAQNFNGPAGVAEDLERHEV